MPAKSATSAIYLFVFLHQALISVAERILFWEAALHVRTPSNARYLYQVIFMAAAPEWSPGPSYTKGLQVPHTRYCVKRRDNRISIECRRSWRESKCFFTAPSFFTGAAVLLARLTRIQYTILALQHHSNDPTTTTTSHSTQIRHSDYFIAYKTLRVPSPL